MECSCEISIDHDGGPSCCKELIRTARKQHGCCECYRDILPGEQYEYISGIWDGHPESYKTCLDCQSLRKVFFDSWQYTTIWDDFYESYRGADVPETCVAALTPAARARVCKMIELDWEDEDEDI